MELLVKSPSTGAMADRPLEYELMMTSYTQLGREFSDDVDHIDAFVPLGIEESELGFDIQIPYLKGIAFQFKRPKSGSPRRFRVRYSDQDPPRQLDRMRNWELKFGPNAAFYALPLVVDHGELSETLHRTEYIPASSTDEKASVIRVPDGYIKTGEVSSTSPIEVYCSSPIDSSRSYTHEIPAADVLGWKGFKRAIETCEAGFKMRWDNTSRFEQYHDDHGWFPRQEKNFDVNIEQIEVSTHADRFVEARAPLLTRIGSKHAFA
jgi:hypothetical protein